MLSSNLQSKPSWLDEFSGTGIAYDFDETGLWFYGNLSGGEDDDDEDTGSYPIRTNFDYSQNDICEVVFSFIHQVCADQGVCFFLSGSTPQWIWGDSSTRIAFQVDCGKLSIVGRSEDEFVLVDGGENAFFDYGETYTIKVIYNPILGSVVATAYAGTDTTGDELTSASVDVVPLSGKYRIGLGADKDSGDGEEYSYFTYLSVSGSTANTLCPITTCDEEVGVGCLFLNASNSNECTCSTMREFRAGFSRTGATAYLPAIAVCRERLF